MLEATPKCRAASVRIKFVPTCNLSVLNAFGKVLELSDVVLRLHKPHRRQALANPDSRRKSSHASCRNNVQR
jgi:hypothetical protein